MRVHINLITDETLNVDISKGTYEFIKDKLTVGDEDSLFNESVKSIEIVE